ncbi:hypothetical protein E2C01_068956 [Portunus trituberculatus]|uniref:Uncharacterized protein n=1 Tax=Portunus trituberculatus TaxID=210409 RepID=A0A5B7HQ76_PORTR|nr:hypothetical protein [Portunus trituberculatus]
MYRNVSASTRVDQPLPSPASVMCRGVARSKDLCRTSRQYKGDACLRDRHHIPLLPTLTGMSCSPVSLTSLALSQRANVRCTSIRCDETTVPLITHRRCLPLFPARHTTSNGHTVSGKRDAVQRRPPSALLAACPWQPHHLTSPTNSVCCFMDGLLVCSPDLQ